MIKINTLAKKKKDSRSKMQKKQQAKRKMKLKIPTLLILVFPQLISPVFTPPSLYKYETIYFGNSKQFDCYSDRTIFYTIRVKEFSGKPISVNLATTAIPESDKFITDTDSQKRYGLYELGGNCFYHTDRTTKNANPLFILVLTDAGVGGTKACKIQKIITNTGLEACSGAATEDIFNILRLEFIDGSPGTRTHFEVVNRDDNFNYEILRPGAYRAFDFSLTNLDDRFMELFLFRGLGPRMPGESVTIFDYKAVENVNNKLQYNPFGSALEAPKVLNRVVRGMIFLGTILGCILG